MHGRWRAPAARVGTAAGAVAATAGAVLLVAVTIIGTMATSVFEPDVLMRTLPLSLLAAGLILAGTGLMATLRFGASGLALAAGVTLIAAAGAAYANGAAVHDAWAVAAAINQAAAMESGEILPFAAGLKGGGLAAFALGVASLAVFFAWRDRAGGPAAEEAQATAPR